jgi:hypothetical protein
MIHELAAKSGAKVKNLSDGRLVHELAEREPVQGVAAAGGGLLHKP